MIDKLNEINKKYLNPMRSSIDNGFEFKIEWINMAWSEPTISFVNWPKFCSKVLFFLPPFIANTSTLGSSLFATSLAAILDVIFTHIEVWMLLSDSCDT